MVWKHSPPLVAFYNIIVAPTKTSSNGIDFNFYGPLIKALMPTKTNSKLGFEGTNVNKSSIFS